MRTRQAFLLLTLAVLVSTHAAAAAVISIAEARALPPGTVVTVEGSVTVPSGDFASSTFDQGFGLQDEVSLQWPSRNFARAEGECQDGGDGQCARRAGTDTATRRTESSSPGPRPDLRVGSAAGGPSCARAGDRPANSCPLFDTHASTFPRANRRSAVTSRPSLRRGPPFAAAFCSPGRR